MCLGLAIAAAAQSGRAQTSSGADVADGLGIGIHFVTPQPGEIEALRDTGVRWVRTDFNWAATETSPGVYDFSAYDALLSQLESARLHTLFILDYSNPLYDHGLSPTTDDARQAFARWAAAAITHYRGHRILWETYNEPNFRFWTPRPNTDDYIKFALTVGEAIQQSAPDEKLVGPATAGIDLPFLEACFKAGLLNYWSAVSIHTYAPGDPERLANDLLRVRLLMRKYARMGKTIPVIVTEWGYSSAWKGMDEQKQAEMLARGWLTQIAADEPLSFWYDWESGSDPHDVEQHFGLIGLPASQGGSVTIPRKPAYQAAQTLTRMLGEFHFNKRLVLEKPDDYVLLFAKDKEVRLAVWTTAAPHQATMPSSTGSFQVTGLTGESLAALVADRHGLDLTLTNQPQYLVPDGPNDLLAIAAAWQRLPDDIELRKPAQLTLHVPLRNPLDKTVHARLRGVNGRSSYGPPAKAASGQTANLAITLETIARSDEPEPASLELQVRSLGSVAQGTSVVAENPLRVTILPTTPKSLPILIADPVLDGFTGWASAVRAIGLDFTSSVVPVKLAPGANDVTIELPLSHAPSSSYLVGAELSDQDRNVVLQIPASRFQPVADFSQYPPGAKVADYKLRAEGFELGENSLSAALPTEGPPEPGMSALKLAYLMPSGRESLDLVTTGSAAASIQGEPKALGLWIYGDGSRVLPYLSFVDSTGQTYEEVGGPINWKGWRYILILMDAPQASHSGGANDGEIHYPIHWDSLLTLRNASNQDLSGAIYLSGPILIYGVLADGR